VSGCSDSRPRIVAIGDPDLQDLLDFSSGAVRERIAADQASGRARRADLLIADSAGIRDRANAEAHDESATRLFRLAGRALSRASANQSADRRGELDAFIADGGLRRFAGSARVMGLMTLADSECSLLEARQAAVRFEEEFQVVNQLTSTDDVVGYLNRRLERAGEGPDTTLRESDDISLICFLLLFFSSYYWLMLMTALYLCQAIHCDAGEVFQQMLRDACS
jgi:hypothetical protein